MQSASKETRLTVILKKYNNLLKEMKKLDFVTEEHTSIIPEINRQNAADVLFFFRFAFKDSSDGFKQDLKNILSLKPDIVLSEEQFERMFELVSPFLQFISSFF